MSVRLPHQMHEVPFEDAVAVTQPRYRVIASRSGTRRRQPDWPLLGQVAYVESSRRDGVGTLVAVELEGWNSVPVGYGAAFDLHSAPWWLRVWFHTPVVDRYAYPVVVHRGYGWLSPQPGLTDDELGRVPAG